MAIKGEIHAIRLLFSVIFLGSSWLIKVALPPAPSTCALVAACGVAATSILVWRRARWYHPTYLLIYAWVVLAVVYPISRNQVDGFSLGQLGWDIKGWLTEAAWIGNVGVFCFALGTFTFSKRQSLRHETGDVPTPSANLWRFSHSTELALWSCWVLATMYLVSTLGLGALRSTRAGANVEALQSISSYPSYTVYWLLLPALVRLKYAQTKSDKRWAYFLFLSSQTLALLSGTRIVLVPALISWILVLLGRNSKNSVRPLSLILIAAVTLMSVVGLKIWRQSQDHYLVKRGQNSIANVAASVFSGQDTAMVASLAIIAKARAEGSIASSQNFTPYIAALTAPVPRQLFANKPRSFDQVLNTKLLPAKAQAGYGFSFTFFGEAIYSGGWLGLIAVPFLTGLFFGRLYRRHTFSPDSKLGLVALALLPQILVLTRGSFTADFPRLVMIALPALLLQGQESGTKPRQPEGRRGVPVAASSTRVSRNRF